MPPALATAVSVACLADLVLVDATLITLTTVKITDQRLSRRDWGDRPWCRRREQTCLENIFGRVSKE